MNNILENKNKIFNNNLPISFFDIVNDTIIKIHKELYSNALEKFKEENKDIDFNEYKIIELKNENNYLKPSNILLMHKTLFTRKNIDLTPYWNNNYINDEYLNIFNELLISDENKKNIEVEDIDYINGKIKFRNKFNNKTFFINTDKIDFNITYRNKLENTFGELLKHANR